MQVDGYGGIQSSGASAQNPEAAKRLAQVPRKENEERAVSQKKEQDSGDVVEISAQARELLQSVEAQQKVEEAEASQDAIRSDAVERARQILQSGTYNDTGKLEATAEKLGDLFRTQA